MQTTFSFPHFSQNKPIPAIGAFSLAKWQKNYCFFIDDFCAVSDVGLLIEPIKVFLLR
jgi:hypothetical protein